MLSRRGFLQRVPFAPVAAVGVVTQAPVVASRLLQASRLTSAPVPMAQASLAERIKWFTNSMQWMQSLRPTLPLPGPTSAITIQTQRALIQWELYAQTVSQQARSYEVPLEDAFKVAQVPLSLLP